MFQIDNLTAVAAIPPPSPAGTVGYFTDGNPATGMAATILPAEFMNMLMMEALNVLSAAGIAPAKGQYDQLSLAIAKIVKEGAVVMASETVAGVLKLSTTTQVSAGADDATSITPLKLAQAATTNPADATPGKLLRVGAFGWGSTSGGPAVSLATAYTSGAYTYSASDAAAPGGAGSDGTVLISSAGGNSYQQLAITTPVTTSNPLLALRTFDGGGTPGPWVSMFHTGNIGTVDPWLMQPIGAVVALRDDLAGVTAPLTASSYRYVVLSASNSYNSGVLSSESVTGTAPLVIATAVISLVGSPLNGKTINLINTERRVLRAGSSGAAEQDALQSHFHLEFVGSPNTQSTSTDTLATFSSGLSAAGAYSQRLPARGGINSVAIGNPITDPDGGPVRGSNETRVKSLGVTYYMRIK